MSEIIDFHIHSGLQHNFFYDPLVIKNKIEKHNIAYAVISSLSGIVDAELGEKELLTFKNSSKFLCTYWVNPYQPNWSNNLLSLTEKLKIWGIKLHPTANIYEPECSFLRPVWQFARENNLFITYHTDTFRSTPSKISELLIEFPDVNVVLIHMDDPINSIFFAKQFSNVYLETSWVERKWKTLAPLKIALDCIDNSKIFFGSDFPYSFGINPVDMSGNVRSYDDIKEIYYSLLPNQTAHRILFQNAKNFLGKYGL